MSRVRPSPFLGILSLLATTSYAGCLLYGAHQYGYRTWLALVLVAGLALITLLTRAFAAEETAQALGIYWPLASLAFVYSAHKGELTAQYWHLLLASATVSVACGMPVLARENVRRAAPWFLLAGALGLAIAYLSGSRGGPDPMRNWFIENFNLSYELAYELTHYTRKTIHFVFYGALAWTTMRGASAAGSLLFPSIVFGAGWALSHAIFDEWRQSFLRGRSGSIWDVALDLLGIATFLGLAWLNRRRRENRAVPGS